MPIFCKEKGCNAPVHARGLCSHHYYMAKKAGRLKPIEYRKTCKVSGCNTKTHAKGFCDFHYRRFLRGVELSSPHKKEISTLRQSYPEEYNLWKAMKQRCSNPNDRAYHRYGGRGIKVCSRWLGHKGFANFISDMGPRPKGHYPSSYPLFSIDRIDNNKGYSPSNCRWATSSIQRVNQERVKKYSVMGMEGTIRKLWQQLSPPGLRERVVNNRIRKLNWKIEDALLTPVKKQRK